jgi:outer membrane biosynthesis protein TonB
MNLCRISALLALLVCVSAASAQTTPPSAPVSDPPPVTDSPPATKPPPATDAAAKTNPKPSAQPAKQAADPSAPDKQPAPANSSADSKGTKTADGDFKPSEDISEDMSVAYPVDI